MADQLSELGALPQPTLEATGTACPDGSPCERMCLVVCDAAMPVKPTAITKSQFDAVARALDKLDRIHDCGHNEWSATVSTPGFAPTFMGRGISRRTCDVCRPIVVEAITKACGAADVIASSCTEGRADG